MIVAAMRPCVTFRILFVDATESKRFLSGTVTRHDTNCFNSHY